MPYTRFFGTADELMDRLNGAVTIVIPANEVPLGAKTLIFTSPAATVTFSGTDGELLSTKQILDDIVAALPPGTVLSRSNSAFIATGSAVSPSIAISVSAVAGGATLSPAGTANPILSLDTSAPLVGVSVDPTKIILIEMASQSTHYILIIAP